MGSKIFKLILIVSITLTSCMGPAVYREELIAGYELSANDDISEMSIYVLDTPYVVGVVNSTVYSVGFDNDFIIAKQHPFVNSVINKAITFYYIIPISYRISNSLSLNRIGPLTQNEFLKKREELEISEKLEFTITIDELK